MLKQSVIIILQRKFDFYLLSPFLKPNLRLTLLWQGQDENSRFVFTEITNGKTPNVYSSISIFLVVSTCAWSVSKRKTLSVWLYCRSINLSCFQFREGFANTVLVPWWGHHQSMHSRWSYLSNVIKLIWLFLNGLSILLGVFTRVIRSSLSAKTNRWRELFWVKFLISQLSFWARTTEYPFYPETTEHKIAARSIFVVNQERIKNRFLRQLNLDLC